MKGSIRMVVGFLLVFGAVGGMDNGNSLLACMTAAVIGLGLMASGVSAAGYLNK